MIVASAHPTIPTLSALAAAAYAWPALRGSRLGPQSAAVWVVAAWLMHGTVLGWNLVGDPP